MARFERPCFALRILISTLLTISIERETTDIGARVKKMGEKIDLLAQQAAEF